MAIQKHNTAVDTVTRGYNSKHIPISVKRAPLGGTQYLFRFLNGYGASLLVGSGYGNRELAVIKYTGPGNDNYDLSYDTPITDDVLGWLSEEDVEGILDQIQGLPSKAVSA